MTPADSARSLLVVVHVLAASTAALAAEPVTVRFAPGQACPSEEQRRELMAGLEALRSAMGPGTGVVVTGYSDGLELRDRGGLVPAPCISTSLPPYLRGHERLAVLRALAVSETARLLGLTPFVRAPIIILGPDDDYASQDPAVPVIRFRRTEQIGESERKAELRLVSPHGEVTAASESRGHKGGEPQSRSPPSPPINDEVDANVTGVVPITPPPGRLAAPPSPEYSAVPGSTRAVVGATLLATGVAGLLTGAGFAGGAIWNTSATSDAPSREQLFHHQDQANQFWIASGVTAAVGVCLAVGGALLMRLSRDGRPRPPESTGSQPSLSVTASGVSLSW